MSPKTQTICTIGPASEKPHVLEKLIEIGMDIARINFSHASYEQFLKVKKLIDQFCEKHNKSVKMLMDLRGPRMRCGELPDEGIELVEGKEVIFSTDPANKQAIFIDDEYLHEDIKKDHPIYLSNGDLELVVTEIEDTEIKAVVIRGGILYSRKGVNVPETDLTTSGITDKDKRDIEFAIQHKIDYIALSFVKDGENVKEYKTLTGHTPIQIISKIERKQALNNLEGIIKESDIIMVARGDLGIEVDLEKLPLIQKDIIKKANNFGRPSIVATQMLISMVNHYRPTRAEVSDVANAVLDGAGYLMLSDETAFGKFPVEALEYLIKTVLVTERFLEKQESR